MSLSMKDLERYVYDRLQIAFPPWPLQIRTRTQINHEYMRLVAEFGLKDAHVNLAYTAGNPVVSLPADLMTIREIRQGQTVMVQVTDAELAKRVAFVNTTTSTLAPVFVMEDPSSIRIDPTPTTTDPNGAELWYSAKPTAMTINPLTYPNEVPEPFHDLIAELVVSRIARDPAVRQDAQAVAASLKSDMRVYLANKPGDGYRPLRLKGYYGRS